MSLPQDTLATFGVSGVYLPPDDESPGRLEDVEAGGIAVQDTSTGLMSHRWRAWVDGSDVWLQRDGASPALQFSAGGITDLALAFDQNMRTQIAYRTSAETLFLRWYDSVIEAYVTTSFGQGRCPKLTLDDKRMSQTGNSDVIFAYIRNGTLYHRKQRERFAVERALKASIPDNIVLKSVGMTRSLRLQFELV